MEYLFYGSLIFLGATFPFLIVLPILNYFSTSDFLCRFLDVHGRIEDIDWDGSRLWGCCSRCKKVLSEREFPLFYD